MDWMDKIVILVDETAAARRLSSSRDPHLNLSIDRRWPTALEEVFGAGLVALEFRLRSQKTQL